MKGRMVVSYSLNKRACYLEVIRLDYVLESLDFNTYSNKMFCLHLFDCETDFLYNLVDSTTSSR